MEFNEGLEQRKLIFNVILQSSLRLAKMNEVSQKVKRNLHVNVSMDKRETELFTHELSHVE